MKKTMKRIVSLLLALYMLASLVTIPTIAAELKSITEVNLSDYSKIRFKGETNKDFSSYEVGEEMIFTFTLWGDDEQLSAPFFKCEIVGDDGKSSTDYYDATSGTVEIRTSVSKAGAVRLVVNIADSNKNIITGDNITQFEGGAIAGVSEIQTTVPEPLDFDEYWEGKLAELDECEPELCYIEQIWSDNQDFDAYIVKINCIGLPTMVASGDTWVTGILSVPKNVTHNWLGLQLHFQGYGVNPVWQIHQYDNISFHVMAHSIEPNRDAGYYWNTEALGLQDYGWSAGENADPDTSYFTYMILRDVQALRFLKKYFGEEGGASFGGVDTSAWKGMSRCHYIQVNGSSQGGFQAISVAALDSDVTNVAAGVPWFADVAGNTDSTRIQSTFRPPYAEGLRYLDTAFMAKRVKAGIVWMTAGTGDTLCPMYGVQAIYNNFNTNVEFDFVQGMCHSATNTIEIKSHQSKSYTENPELPDEEEKQDIVTGHITESYEGSTTVDNNWSFDRTTGILTVTANVDSGWNECGSVVSAGSWVDIITEIKEVILVGNMGKVSGKAFQGATNLVKVTIPESVRQINDEAFSGCEKLETIVVSGEPEMEGVVNLCNIISTGNSVADCRKLFEGATAVKAVALSHIYSAEYPISMDNLPVNIETIYGNTEYLEDFCARNGIKFVPFGKASSTNAYWTIDVENETLTLFGDGAVTGIEDAAEKYSEKVKHIVIENGINELGDDALSVFSSLEDAKFEGDAPKTENGARPFGEQSENFVIKVGEDQDGFDGYKWCGYTIEQQTFIPGDANGDRTVSVMDVVLIAQYIAKWEVQIDKLAADVTGDGAIDTSDAVLLAQHLAKWKVVLVGGRPTNPDPEDPDDPSPDVPEKEIPDNEVDVDNIMNKNDN